MLKCKQHSTHYDHRDLNIFFRAVSAPEANFDTGQARLIRSHSSASFCFELSGNSNYIIHCNSNYVQNFELEINSI